MTDATQLYLGPTVAELYRSAFKSFKQRDALVKGHVRLTYEALERLVHQTVRYFQVIGLRRQDGVAILADNSLEAVVAIIAAQYLGLRSTALHPLGSLEDQAFVLRDADIKALVVDTDRFAKRGAELSNLGIVGHILTLSDADFGVNLLQALTGMSAADTPILVSAQDISKLSYTGGTTGQPKGVMQLQRTVVCMTLLQLASWEWPEDIRFLATTPISHAAGSCLLPTFLRGGTVFFMPKFDNASFLSEVQTHRITATFLVPTQLYGLLDFPSIHDYDVSSLQMILYGAAPMVPARLMQGLKVFGPIFCQLYGQTEAPMTVTYLRKAEHDLSRPHLLGSCGRTLPGVQVKLLDKLNNEVNLGEVGELCVRGPLVMAGYLNQPEETAKAFEGEWLHTGDMAKMDADGYVFLVDRAKDMIISGGFNVYSSEVENCLARHPAVAMSAVIGMPHVKWGEIVTAVVVLKDGAHANAEELMRFVSTHKGSVNTPKQIFFDSSLPLTAVGKLDKKAIRARYDV
ncbi:AMP-binding protein [Alcaligenaceae bacterium]|nr:AMP-binding protein [Alcaligenaceae bacterium]